MSDANIDQDELGFGFTYEDFARRYFPRKSSGAAQPANPAPSAPLHERHTGRLHGGGNSFMRARRRRLAASQIP